VTNKFPEPVKARYVRIYPINYHGHPAVRAGILVCERDCEGGYLNYKLAQEMTSASGGPMLTAPWGQGRFYSGKVTHSKGNGHRVNSERSDQRYQVRNGNGLQLEETRCIKNPKVFSVVVRGRLTSVSGWRQVFGSSSWDEDGLYVNKIFRMQPATLKLKCKETILQNRWYDFGLTRDSKGKLSLYLNGYLCATGSGKAHNGFALGDSVRFFRSGDSGKQPSGAIQRIRMWNKALGQGDMAKTSMCTLSEVGKECKGYIAMNPAYKYHRYSSVWGNYRVGTVYGQGMLNSRRAWLARTSRTGFDKGEWMQLDLGKVQDVAGLVTQGRGDGGWWVKGYAVRVSDDQSSWKEVACGRVFDANRDMNTKVKNLFPDPVKARYVRIYPMVYHGHPSMRAGVLVCEKECKKGHVDYQFKESLTSSTDGPMLETPWGEGRFDSRRNYYRFGQGQGLKLDESSCIGPKKWTILVHVKIDRVHSLRQIIGSDAWSTDGLYVNNKLLRWNPDVDGLKCESLVQHYKWHKFGLTRGSDGTLSIYHNGYRCAQGKSKNKDGYKLDPNDVNFLRGTPHTSTSGYLRRIQMWNTDKGVSDMAELSGCRLPTEADDPCKATIVYNAPYDKHRYSKVWANDRIGYRYGRGRLDSRDAFIPPNAAVGYASGNWMQLDAGSVEVIAGVVMQGRRAGNQYLRTFLARVSKDGKKWYDVECGRAFPANRNWNRKENRFFSKPLMGRYIRIYVDTYNNWPSWRAGLLLCEKNCKGHKLDYALQGDYGSSTNGPMIEAAWGAGRYYKDQGWYFDNGEGLRLNEENCISKKSTYTILMNARLRWNTGSRLIFGSKSWGNDGGVAVADGANYQLLPSSAEVECPWKIFNDRYYNFGITRDDKGDVSLYLNGMKCASGKPKGKDGYKIDPSELTFMHAWSRSYSSPSWIKHVRTWNKALKESEMAKVAGCKLGSYSKKDCKTPGEYNVRYSGHRYSSTWANDKLGYRHGRGRLDSRQAWSSRCYHWHKCRGYKGNNWMQLDAGSVKSIAGIITQGRRHHHQWVTQYKVKASADGKSWDEVDCGRTFAGNTNRNTRVTGRFTKPVSARYIRIYIDGWRGHPSMRAGLLLCDASYTQRKPSSWDVRVYKGNNYMWDMPDESTLTYVGKGKPKFIDFSNADDIRKYVKGVPEKNFAAIVEGTIQIKKAGEYKICGQSSDGDTIKMDGKDLVVNEGVHGVSEKCKKTKLKAGPHKVKMSYFQNSGKVDLEAAYSGPDTADEKIPLPSDDFEMAVYSSKDDIVKKPDLSSMTEIGPKVSIPDVNFHNLAEFKKYVPDAPSEYFAMDFYGTFEIDMPGNYYFCTISDDGSRLWVDSEGKASRPLIDNGGNHGNRRYCRWKKMTKGKHSVHGDYFQGRGGMHLQVTYRGPDTDDVDVDLRSEGVKMPKRPAQSKWEMRLFQKPRSWRGTIYRMPRQIGELDYIGTRVVPAIDFDSLDDVQRYYGPELKSMDNTAIQWYGQLKIRKPGHYYFCTRSDDGSHLWIFGRMLVNNGGAHGARTICRWKHHVKPGTYPMKVDWFNGRGGWSMRASYYGPDTNGKRVLIASSEAIGPPKPYKSEWLMRIFKANSRQYNMPDPATMQSVGDAVVPYINFKNINQFRKYVPSVPNSNVVASIEGSFDIKERGTYEICSKSAYGSHVWVEGNMLVDNGGRHGHRRKCSSIVLKKGKVAIKSDFFTSWYGYLVVTYEGPDTDGKRKAIMSDDLKMQLYADKSTLYSVPASLAGLQKIGKVKKIPAISFKSMNDFRQVVPGVPHSQYSAIFTGKVEIRNKGVYEFCSRSQDGSIISIGGHVVLDYDGRHGAHEKCGSKTLKKGQYETKVEYFQGSWGGYAVVKYQGPDTWGIKELLGSKEPATFKRTERSQWTMRLFMQPTSRGWLRKMPNFAWLDYLGEAKVPAIDFKSVPDLRRYVPDTPWGNVAGAWFGKTNIVKAGDYQFCTHSNDGSFLWFDGVMVVDNGGAHGTIRKCGTVKGVKAGKHTVKVTWWQGWGGMRIKATYIGPDTRNRERLLGATTQWAPPKVKKSKWHVKVYEFSSSKTDKLPDEDDDKDKLKLKGEGTWPWIGLRHNHDLRKIVKETPYYRFMWVYTGGVVILKAGKYTICDASDDGSKVWIEGKLEIDNDGLHSRKEVCTVMNLKAKTYYFKVAGFSADHDCVQVLKYAGPDTANRKVYVNAVGKAVPPKKKESGAKKEEGGDKKK